MNRDPLSVAIKRFENQHIVEADVLNVHNETRTATIRLRSTNETVRIRLGDIDPQEVRRARSKLLVYVGPHGGIAPVGIIHATSASSAAPGVTLGDSMGGTKWCIYNSKNEPVTCFYSNGNIVQTGYVSYTYSYGGLSTYAKLGGSFWELEGNVGTTYGTHFLGTTDDEPLDLRAGGRSAMRFYPTYATGEVSVVGGCYKNRVDESDKGQTIGGGGTVASPNITDGDFATIGGGIGNSASAAYSIIGGGASNSVSAVYSTVGGGIGNSVSAVYSFIGGGYGNSIAGANWAMSTVGGGWYNQITGGRANTICGGWYNTVAGYYNFLGGGWSNQCTGSDYYNTIVGGYYNRIIGASAYAGFIGGGNSNLINNVGKAGIVCGTGNEITGWGSFIGSGYSNDIQRPTSVICGGGNNLISGNGRHHAIGGGFNNTINIAAGGDLRGSVIGGGIENTITSTWAATIPGGYYGKADKYGQVVTASGRFGADGDAQGTIQGVLRRQIEHSDASYYALYPDGSGTFKWPIASSAAWTFNAKVVGGTRYQTYNWGYEISGVIANRGGTVTMLSASTTALYEDLATFHCRAVADDANDALQIEVCDAASYGLTVRWVATLRTAEMVWA